MKIYEYKDYNDYVEKQTFYNKQKLNWVYVREACMEAIFKDIHSADAIICHGTRNGAEQKFFKKYFPDAMVIGTEISDTATQFPMTVQHDFSKPKDEWVNKFDIVYSNAFDHSITPLQTLITWRDQLTDEGKLYIEYSESQSVCEPADPLMATSEEVKELIDQADMVLENTLRGKMKNGGVIFCIRKNQTNGVEKTNGI